MRCASSACGCRTSGFRSRRLRTPGIGLRAAVRIARIPIGPRFGLTVAGEQPVRAGPGAPQHLVAARNIGLLEPLLTIELALACLDQRQHIAKLHQVSAGAADLVIRGDGGSALRCGAVERGVILVPVLEDRTAEYL